MEEITIKVGDLVNGMEIVEIQEKDPFNHEQSILWTNEDEIDSFGDRERIGFRVIRHKE